MGRVASEPSPHRQFLPMQLPLRSPKEVRSEHVAILVPLRLSQVSTSSSQPETVAFHPPIHSAAALSHDESPRRAGSTGMSPLKVCGQRIFLSTSVHLG